MENICQGNLSGDFSYIMDIFLLPRVTGATVINKNAKPCKNHTEVCKCNAPNMYIHFIQLKRYEHFLRVEDTVSLWLQIADLLSLQQLFEVIMFVKRFGNQN